MASILTVKITKKNSRLLHKYIEKYVSGKFNLAKFKREVSERSKDVALLEKVGRFCRRLY